MRLVWRTTCLTLLALIAGSLGLFPSLQARDRGANAISTHNSKLITPNYGIF